MRPGAIFRAVIWLPCLLIGALMLLVLGIATCLEWASVKWGNR